MAEPVTLDRESSAVLIMDLQIRIVNHVASDPQGVSSPLWPALIPPPAKSTLCAIDQ